MIRPLDHDRRTRQRPLLWRCAVAFCLILPSVRGSAEDDAAALPVSVPVKTLPASGGTPERAAPGMDVAAMAPTQPTLPDAKLPQYQLSSPLTSAPEVDRSQQSPLRLLLTLPTRSVVIQAKIEIDGQPFQTARQRRAERIVAEAKEALARGDAASPASPDDDSTINDSTVDDRSVNDRSGDGDDGEGSAAAAASGDAYQMASSDEELARRYFVSTGMEVSHDAVRWLLATRVDGPPLLLLNDYFQRFRSDQRPAFDVLDADEDAVLSAAEIAQAVDTFLKCDLNRNDVVDYLEIEEVAKSRKMLRPAQTDSETLLRLLPTVDRVKPDIQLMIAFDTADPQKSTLTVEHLEPALQIRGTKDRPSPAGDPSAIVLSIDGVLVSLSAIQPQAAAGIDQISVGAVDDGYPLLPVLDPNDDGRFTLREMRELVDRLRTMDRDGNEQLEGGELSAPVRVCIGLGPTVHRELADIRTVSGEETPTPTTAVPEWFVRMDRNADADLTRSEFPGTDEQFKDLDRDGDGLISGEEALDDGNSQP